MSGRSAYVRAKKTELAEKKSTRGRQDLREQDENDIISALSVLPPVAPAPTTFHPNVSAALQATYGPYRRQSNSSARSCHHHHHHARRPRVPVIETSAIEKSDFRTHLDGMSATLRSKLGRFLNAKTEDTSFGEVQRPDTAYGSSSSESRVQSFGLPPSTSQSTSSGKSPANDFGPSFTSAPHAPVHLQQKALVSRVRKFESHMPQGRAPEQGYQASRVRPSVIRFNTEHRLTDKQDTEMWFEDGDVLVYLFTHGGRVKPAPSMRLSSKMIEESGSKEFIRQLRSGHVPAGFPQFLPHNPASSARVTTPDETTGYETSKHSQGMSTDPDSPTNLVRPLKVRKKPSVQGSKGIRYELYIPWPGVDSGMDQLLWHLTTRNFFAMLLDKDSVWGQTFFQTFHLVFERIVKFPDYLPRNIDRGEWIAKYIARKNFDDVRNNPSFAAGLIAFSEMIRWREGYIEGFVHCSGMLKLGLQNIPEYRNVSAVSRIYIETASKEMLKRVHRAQIWLAEFDFSEMWPITSAPAPAAKGAFERFGKWLRRFYENAYGRWPPPHEHTWLNRDIIKRLNTDFHMIYDFFVDRDVLFAASSGPASSRPHTMKSKSGKFFRADTSDLPITDILIGFDNRQNFPHIPYPYPITPPSFPVHTNSNTKSSFFGPRSKKPLTAAETYDIARAKALSYTQASNLYTLRNRYRGTAEGIVKKILEFEESDGVRAIDPFDARRGRWILIYGVLQILATVGVDAPNARWKEGVSYYLSPPMAGIVPWAADHWPAEPEAAHELSHCWTVPATWDPSWSGSTFASDPRLKLTPGRQHVNSPTNASDSAREDGSKGDKSKRFMRSGRLNSGNHTSGHQSNSSAQMSGSGVGNSKQAIPWRSLAVSNSTDGKTWIEDDEATKYAQERSSGPDPVDRRRRAEEWVVNDANGIGVGYGGEGTADFAGDNYQDGSNVGTSYMRSGHNGLETVIVGVGVADENPPSSRLSLAARRRRLQVHGFSTFGAPQGW